ncbi:MAG: hypothetical protein K2Q25_01335 [Mycobacteriaceae bacterium]|nr:hypothetical protein [Mycobacteriaceae bacterium]
MTAVAGLFVAFVPMLLILATVGLGRLEIWLGHDTVTVTDVAEFLHRAQRPVTDQGMPPAVDWRNGHRIQTPRDVRAVGASTGKHHAAPFLVSVFNDAVERGLPTRPNTHSLASSPVKPTRHVNHV